MAQLTSISSANMASIVSNSPLEVQVQQQHQRNTSYMTNMDFNMIALFDDMEMMDKSINNDNNNNNNDADTENDSTSDLSGGEQDGMSGEDLDVYQNVATDCYGRAMPPIQEIKDCSTILNLPVGNVIVASKDKMAKNNVLRLISCKDISTSTCKRPCTAICMKKQKQIKKQNAMDHETVQKMNASIVTDTVLLL